MEMYDGVKIQEISETLCSNKSLNIFLRSKSFEGMTTEKAPWFETKYSCEAFSEELVSKMANPCCEAHKSKKLDLPLKNDMIPENFEILQVDFDKSDKPQLIFEDDFTHVWYMKDDKFKKPKCQIKLTIYTSDNDFGKTIEG